MKVEVVAYDSNWIKLYNEEKGKINSIIENELIHIYHIGSTSVPNMKSKPIIDIMVVVRCIGKMDEFNHQFEELGYECMGEYGITGRRYFRKGINPRTHHIHIFEETNEDDIVRHLAVREYLCEYRGIATEYAQLKSKLALQFPSDIEGYCDGKDSFVKEMEKKAVEWYKRRNK